MNIAVLIATCDKNIDISQYVVYTLENFEKSGMIGYVSTETNCDPFKGIKCFKNNSNFSSRLLSSLQNINEDYVLILLDDYFVYDESLEKKYKEWTLEISENGLSVLKICSDGKVFKKIAKGKRKTKIFKKINVYDIDFHPTIWKKDVLVDVLVGKNISPWEIEPLFARYITNKKIPCGISSQKIQYDELIVGGKFFRREFKRHCKHTYCGQRKKLKFFQDFLFRIKRFIYHITPRFFIEFVKKIKRQKGYSDLN